MCRLAFLLPIAITLSILPAAFSQDKPQAPAKKLPDGVYAVQRDGQTEKDLLPLKDGEAIVTDRHPYLKNSDKEPTGYLVVHSAPEVELTLAAEPKAEKDGDQVVRILLKLQPKAAAALEKLTRDHLGKQIAIVLNGEVVTAHKVRDVIKDGDAQITSCTPGAADYLLKQLQAKQKTR
jgi:preprotein translocase subunit SecD